MKRARAVLLSEVMSSYGLVAPERLSERLRVTRRELASAAGLSKDAVSKAARQRAPRTQARLREVVEIVTRVLPWAGSETQAFAWYRAQPLPSFGDLTAEDLVKAGRGEDVLAYLSRIAAGGYA